MTEYPQPELDTTADDNPVASDYEPTDEELAAIEADLDLWDDPEWFADEDFDFGDDEDYPHEESDLY